MTPKHKLFLLAAFMDENDIRIHLEAFTGYFPDLSIMVGENHSIEIDRDIEGSYEFTCDDIIEQAKGMK